MSGHRSTRGLLVAAFAVAGASAFGQAPEPAVARNAKDAQLQWGPCPAFMPAGCALAVLHGDPTRANADVLLKLPARAAISDHWHTSAERMVLIAGELHVTYQDQAKSVLKPGMYAYGPAKRPHRAACVGSAPCILFIAFESPVDAVPIESAK